MFEKEQNESLLGAIKESGKSSVNEFHRVYSHLNSDFYIPTVKSIAEKTVNSDLVLVHSATDIVTISVLGELKRKYDFRLVFFDDSYIFADSPSLVEESNLSLYDLILVNSQYLFDAYSQIPGFNSVKKLCYGIDTEVFYPRKSAKEEAVAVLNMDWFDDSQTEKIEEFFIKPVRDLRVKAAVYGSRYPRNIKKLLGDNSIDYKGWLPSFKLPEVFGKFITGVYIPDENSHEYKAGIPSLSLLEMISSGVPVLSADWKPKESFLTPARDYLVAKDSYEMKHFMLEMMNSTLKEVISGHGVKSISSRHTCKQRASDLNAMINQMINLDQGMLLK